jgi:hypothetical protein
VLAVDVVVVVVRMYGEVVVAVVAVVLTCDVVVEVAGDVVAVDVVAVGVVVAVPVDVAVDAENPAPLPERGRARVAPAAISPDASENPSSAARPIINW